MFINEGDENKDREKDRSTMAVARPPVFCWWSSRNLQPSLV